MEEFRRELADFFYGADNPICREDLYLKIETLTSKYIRQSEYQPILAKSFCNELISVCIPSMTGSVSHQTIDCLMADTKEQLSFYRLVTSVITDDILTPEVWSQIYLSETLT